MRIIYSVIVCLGLLACNNENNKTENSEMKENGNKPNKEIAKDSTYVEYYENGSKKVIADTVNGKYHGLYNRFYMNGNIAESGIMINGFKSGVWKGYNEKGILVNVAEYYNDKLLFNLDKSNFSLLPKAIEQEGIEINIPINWETKDGDTPNMLFVSQKKCDEATVFCPNITLTKEKLKDDMNLGDYLQSSIELLNKQLSNFKPVAKGEVLINGLSAFQITYLMQVNGVKLGGITTWINSNDTIYIITGMAINETNSEFLKYKGLFQEITDTFKKY